MSLEHPDSQTTMSRTGDASSFAECLQHLLNKHPTDEYIQAIVLVKREIAEQIVGMLTTKRH